MAETTSRNDEAFMLNTSRYFPQWLARHGVSLAFTSYQAGRLFLIGLNADSQVAGFERTYPRSMGLAASGDSQTLFMATQNQVIRFDNVVAKGGLQGQHDAVYAPHAMWVTGDLDIHDVAIGADGRPLFISSLVSCIAAVSDNYSFRPVWKPPFISKLAPEDRCHLNGLALEDGKPRWVTLVAPTDMADGWHDRRQDGGQLIDVTTGEAVLKGLAMPHSPRVHKGRVWLLNSGMGEFGYADLEAGKFVPVALCPGFARGMTLFDDFAIVALSLPRDDRMFRGLQLDQVLADKGVAPRCGLLVIDIRSGDVVEWLRVESGVRELYDVAVLRGVRHPAAVALTGDDINRVISIDPRQDVTPEVVRHHEGIAPITVISQ